MHQRKQFPQRFLVSVAPLAEQLGDRLSRGSGRRHRGMLAAANCITIEGFLQHSRRQSKKPRRSWRVSGGLSAYAHEPAQTTNPPEKPKTKTKPRKSKTYANNNQL
jgi:hypothetical protein